MNLLDISLKTKEELKEDLASILTYNDLIKLSSACREILESGEKVDIAESEIIAWLEHLGRL